MKPTVKTVAHQSSWILRSRDVEVAVTRLGGHMAPVTFDRRARKIRPYYINPWQGEGGTIDAAILRPLRGDFFCMPFGANLDAWRGEQHIVHGETACLRWRHVSTARSGGVSSLTLSMRTKVRAGTVTKRLSLVDGQNAVYIQHELAGYSGPMPLGHHAILAMPDKPESVLLATSPIRFGRTNPVPAGLPEGGEYSSLAPDRQFRDLSRVPLIWKDTPTGDCSSFPTRAGFTDILAVFNKAGRDPAWTAATNTVDGYLWFVLKDPEVLPATVLWISNRGRHGAPWNGRNCCLGVEDVCAHFADGLAASVRPNVLTRSGVPTAIRLSPTRPTAVRAIQGVVKVPRTFGHVTEALFAPGKVTFVGAEGRSATAPVQHEFLATGDVG